ncbi:helix-turn-helix transcriptional regulator [Streptomyces sp. H27-H1]|uniref:helix-turn-helix domain-containing protein n=1 Tax=Streptomyces sp. H27-H1 TaxID=2996461 RepID=UPI00226FBD17|nr:helix-turn-helix transcriptional regulator [Streptomyces sp. H27-H1]MCY0931171.1 helix-turn-helix transcriptional regulator [Streptomyces sp. H27-H1]
MSEQQRGRRAIETGPTGMTVAENLARLRKVRGFTTRQLSGVLERNGRLIPASGITRMEKAERQVTVDELVALAVALDVSPVTLLLPANARGGKDVNGIPEEARTEVTGVGEVGVVSAWRWAWCQDTLEPSDPDAGEEEADRRLMDFLLNSRPIGLLSAQGDDRIMSAAIGSRKRRSDGSSVD